MKANVTMGIILIIFSILAFTQVKDLPVKAALFPKLILFGIGVVGILLTIDSIVKNKKNQDGKSGLNFQSFIFQVVIPGIALLMTYFLIPFFGFYISSFL